MPADNAANISMPQPIGLFAGDLYARGIKYLDAASQLDYICNKNFLLPVSFLISHALELFLKSYLAASGVDKHTIREEFGHRLQKIYRACFIAKLPTIDNLERLVENISEMNNKNDFRYPTGCVLTVINPSQAIEVVKSLANAIGPQIEIVRIKARLNFAAATRHLKSQRIEWSD